MSDMLQEKPKPGETWEDVMQKAVLDTEVYEGVVNCIFIPAHTAEGLIRCAYYGRRLAGDFLKAVFNNDLQEAFGRADHRNAKALHNIVKWVYNVAPQGLRNPEFPGLIAIAEGEDDGESRGKLP